MDAELRRLERTDRPRFLVECHRRGMAIVYQPGDKVVIVRCGYLPYRPYAGQVGWWAGQMQSGVHVILLDAQIIANEVKPYGC